ncbi:RimK family alpha-L-glutamate ligase [Actinomycetes bacterium NPDC127524]
MINGWLIYSKSDAEKNQGYINWMLEEAGLLGISLDLHFREDFQIGYQNQELFLSLHGNSTDLPSFAIVRTIDPFFTKQLELMGVKCYNSSFVSEICNDKAKTHQYLSSHGIPMADTLFYETSLDRVFSFPYIVKEVHGRGGNAVYLAENENDKKKIRLDPHGKWIVQRPAQLGKDVRVFVIGKKVIAAVLRHSDRDFKANFTLGGSASLYELSEDEHLLAEKIASLFDFGLAGIDFIFNDDGSLLLNEIEDVVGSRTLSMLSDINLVREYLTFICDDLNVESQ